MLVGDKNPDRANACGTRLKALSAPATSFVGPAIDTIPKMVAAVPRGALCCAYVDPYNLELLSFEILKELARLKVDLAINFSTMDLPRNAELEFDSDRRRFDGSAPGWQEVPSIANASKANMPAEFFKYWCGLVEGLGFQYSREMPLVRNDQGRPIYRMVFFARHDLPKRIWADVARGPNRTLGLF
jgi:three-Cys-motif partner protein